MNSPHKSELSLQSVPSRHWPLVVTHCIFLHRNSPSLHWWQSISSEPSEHSFFPSQIDDICIHDIFPFLQRNWFGPHVGWAAHKENHVILTGFFFKLVFVLNVSILKKAVLYIETRLPYIQDSPSHQNRPNTLFLHHTSRQYVYTRCRLSYSGIDLGHMSQELCTKKS